MEEKKHDCGICIDGLDTEEVIQKTTETIQYINDYLKNSVPPGAMALQVAVNLGLHYVSSVISYISINHEVDKNITFAEFKKIILENVDDVIKREQYRESLH